ncbi:MAG: hypothetical protein V3U54_12855 [Thermodesulfobacteriota bacterium]
MSDAHWVADVRSRDPSKFRMELDYDIINTVIKSFEKIHKQERTVNLKCSNKTCLKTIKELNVDYRKVEIQLQQYSMVIDLNLCKECHEYNFGLF